MVKYGLSAEDEDAWDEVLEVNSSYVQAKHEVNKALVDFELGVELLKKASASQQPVHTPDDSPGPLEIVECKSTMDAIIKKCEALNLDTEVGDIPTPVAPKNDLPVEAAADYSPALTEKVECEDDDGKTETSEFDVMLEKSDGLKEGAGVEDIPTAVMPKNSPTMMAAAADSSPALAEKVECTSKKESSEFDDMLKKCKAIALEKAFHSTLVKDETMCSFLVYCLGEELEERVVQALQIFHLLSSNPENRPYLSKLPMFFDAVRATAMNKKLNKEVRDFAVEVYGNVKKIHKPLKAHRGNRLPDPKQEVKDKEAKSEHKSHKAQPGKNQSVSKTSRVSQFYIPQCIFKEKRLKMTEALLTLQGVISITYDMNKSYCVVRGKLHVPSEVFGTAIANIGYECHMVTKSEHNEDILTRMAADSFEISKSNYDQENVPTPDYCSDSDSDVNSPEKAQAVALQENEKQKAGWLSSAKNLFQRSFYW